MAWGWKEGQGEGLKKKVDGEGSVSEFVGDGGVLCFRGARKRGVFAVAGVDKWKERQKNKETSFCAKWDSKFRTHGKKKKSTICNKFARDLEKKIITLK